MRGAKRLQRRAFLLPSPIFSAGVVPLGSSLHANRFLCYSHSLRFPRDVGCVPPFVGAINVSLGCKAMLGCPGRESLLLVPVS